MTMEQFNQEIDQALIDAKEGRLIEASDLKTKIDSWD